MNPFIYPKSKHKRTQKPRQYKRYKTYKRVLRVEFFGKCVYCQMPSTMGKYEMFGVDHYRPQKYFPDLSIAYSNLYYCCNACNSGKGSYWPKTPALEKTHFIPNPCDHPMFEHLRFKRAKVEARTLAGQVALELLDLNDPESLEFREFILGTMELWQAKRRDLLAKREEAGKRVKAGTIIEAVAAQATAEINAQVAIADRWLRKLSGQL